MMFRTILHRKTFETYSLVPDKYIHTTQSQLLLEIPMLNLSSRLNIKPNSVAIQGKIHNAVLKILAAEDNYIDTATLLQRTRGLQ